LISAAGVRALCVGIVHVVGAALAANKVALPGAIAAKAAPTDKHSVCQVTDGKPDNAIASSS